MMVSGKEIFLARPWIEEHRRLEFQHPINVPLRTMVIIEMPVMDLRQLCLLKVVDSVETEDNVTALELPTVLKKELMQMISSKKSCKML